MITIVSICLTLFLVIAKGYWNTFRPEEKLVHVPLSTKGKPFQLNILQLSDIHVENLSVKADRVIAFAAKQTEPIDMIALTGDYLDRVKSIPHFLAFLEQIVQIPTKYGVYAVWGNHDWVIADELPRLKVEMEKLGVVVLENETVTLQTEQGPVHIIGIDDHYSKHAKPIEAFTPSEDDGIRVVITHDPLVVREIPYQFDYLLCGHFHCGQIHYPLPVHSLKMGLKPYKSELAGLQEADNGRYYISAGLGQTGANLRVGCRPEMTLHLLAAATQQQTNTKRHIA